MHLEPKIALPNCTVGARHAVPGHHTPLFEARHAVPLHSNAMIVFFHIVNRFHVLCAYSGHHMVKRRLDHSLFAQLSVVG
jgi:hypothetical protein